MIQFPVNLNLRERNAVIVGGGAVAARKCLLLMEAGARVTVIAPRLDPRLEELWREGRIICHARQYGEGDLADAFLAFAATDNPAVNLHVARDAAALGILVDITGAPEHGSFTTPAHFRRGDLLVAVSTGGKNPALAQSICNDLAQRFGPEYAETVAILGAVREKLLTVRSNRTYNKAVLRTLADADLPGLIRRGEYETIDRLLVTHAGPGFTLASLGTRTEDPA
ncbi:precorrin-2 dehydrogenase/sirohydrochlorin ferrochelatase family protein [Geobacter grbiciae]|uniref:precorrin-2 dehydrogenase/sirohydrochlorin ferrochelatase family protein n=1 Tax=Geobacter grbiciae TaxID=155042 RepID=UPI001C01179D|nr:bifunctional precorrin-2 dehydrogenase/sirohydrochlorin ferrochelatase [Geobacter grbiciae]MBT1074729.1 bifunctional precorrin-2 dehydrogenase/sirohydrochlorin ferrochelatase [Geobacter grbiciae]